MTLDLPSILEEAAVFPLAIVAVLSLWTGVREWRQFLLKEPYKPAPRWIERLTLYACFCGFPWAAYSLVHFLRHADGKSLFVACFLGFCFLISLAAKYWGSGKSGAPSIHPANSSH